MRRRASPIEQDLELQSADVNKATIRYTRHPLDVSEVQQHLQGWKAPHPTRGSPGAIALSFVLTDKTQVKRIEFLGDDQGHGGRRRCRRC